jgi:predicted component of viral defense system (DUF524 family)
MASLPTSSSDLVFRDAKGITIDALEEWRRGFIELSWLTVEDLVDLRVDRGDQELAIQARLLDGATRIVAEWPLSGTGNYELSIRRGPDLWHASVRIGPSKLSSDQYEAMLDELETELPTSIAIALQNLGALAGLDIRPPSEMTLAEELRRLRRAVIGTSTRPGLAQVLPEIQREPHRMLERNERWVRVDQARRPEPAAFPLVIVAADNLSAQGRPHRVVDTRAEHTVDVFENRIVKAFAAEAGVRLRRLTSVAERRASEEVREEVATLTSGLVAAHRRAAFLADVSRLTAPPNKTTMVLLRRPPYRAALEGWIELRRSLAVWLDQPHLESPLENLPSLYQTWGTLQAVLALLRAAAEAGYEVTDQTLTRRVAGTLFVQVLPDGAPAVTLLRRSDQTRVQLRPELSYSSTSALRSITYSQRPDVSISLQRPGEPPVLYLLDPKYKLDSERISGASTAQEEASTSTEQVEDPETEAMFKPVGSPKKLDIDKMHAYRDAIRDGEDRRVVSYAAILYPGPTVTPLPPDVEALSAIPGSTELRESLHERMLQWLA